MWSKIILCLFVGLVAASNDGWKSDSEYKYQIRGRTLTGLQDLDDQYSGVMIKAELYLQPKSDGLLNAVIKNSQYAQVHAQLPGGWDSHIPESQLSYQACPLTQQPFQIRINNGVVEDLIVSKQVANWEANIIKSIVSQIQLDTQGVNVIPSSMNQLPEEGSHNAVYKTMEETVTGKYQTLYDINPLPEYILQSKPYLVPYPQMKGDGEIIDIIKSKNFSKADERAGFHYGFGNMKSLEPSTSHMGDFFLRSSVSRAVISGSLKRYTLQSSVTTNKIVLSPTFNNRQKGLVVSQMNLTLAAVQQPSNQIGEPSSPVSLKSLVYRFDEPFSSSNEPRPSEFSSEHQRQDSAFSSSSSSSSSSSEESRHQQAKGRPRRSHHASQEDQKSQSSSSSSSSFSSVSSEEYWQQDEPKLQTPPESPMLPYYVGYKGKSIKNAQNVNIAQAVQKIAQQIGQELQRPEQIPKEQTLAKYTILSALTRIMSQQEMQEVSRQLYNKDVKGAKRAAWEAYRDAVAECGTGPALLTMQDWIQNMKLQPEEAAEVVAAVAESARQPTDDYMRNFYAFITKPEVRDTHLLNDTAYLSYGNLVRKVYVNKYESHNQYPVHSFGSFRSKAGVKFIVDEVIPYFSEQLHKAVSEADSHKIIVYTRALGNIAHQKVLRAFEPYLEGQKQASQFQRLQMVLAFDQLVKAYPRIARSVLYKIYQNAGDAEEVRTAAVYQLMRTGPSGSMLQRMAQYTNIDTAEQVNAAVKSSIQHAANLESSEFASLRHNARAAHALLTPKHYGPEYAKNYLRSYVVKEMNFEYKKTLQTIGSEDSWVPKGVKSALRATLGGIKTQLWSAEAMVSSVEELTNVLKHQTESYQKEYQQQQQHSQQAQQHQWSAEHIGRFLDIQTEEREQLEGSLLYRIGQTQRIFAFNNRTIELLPKVLRQIEDLLRSGKEFEYTKFHNHRELAISFPTEMALPFVYTFDVPAVIKISGQVQANAEPRISNGEKLGKPNKVNVNTKIHAVYSSRIQAQLGFFTPYDHQHYTSGYDKNIQFNIPIKANFELDIENKQVRAEIEPMEPERNARVFQYSSWPYTAKSDILSLQPLANRPTTQIIATKPQINIEKVLGKQAGMAFRLKYSAQQKFMDAEWVAQQIRRHDIISIFLAPKFDENMQQCKITLEYLPEESSSRKVNVRLGYTRQYQQNPECNEGSVEINKLAELPQQPQDSKARQEKLAKLASCGIKNSLAYAADVAVEFEGQEKVQYIATAAVAKSNVDEKSRVLAYFKKQSANPQGNKPFELAFSAKSHIPNTNGLDFNYALKFDPTTTTHAELAFGENLNSASKIKIQAKLRKSDDRKMYLQKLPLLNRCRKEMEEGNYQLPACANMTASANLMDRVSVQLQYEHLSPRARNLTYHAYDALRYFGYYHLDENRVNATGNGKPNQLDFEARFYPDFSAVNVSLKTENMEARLRHIRLNDCAKRIFAVHPAFPVTTRANAHIHQWDSYRPFCVVDQNAANTFDNRTYPIELGEDWTVMMQYVPRYARYSQQNRQQQQQQDREQHQIEQYAVLVRDSKAGQNRKEVKLTLRSPKSKGQLYEVELYPTQQSQPSAEQPAAKVIVNQKEYQISDKQSVDIEDRLLEIYALPNGEVKVEVTKRFYILYDGHRVRLSTSNDKFRDAIRGLCGTFTGEPATDFRTPKNCILRDPKEFAASYAVAQPGSQSKSQQLKARAEQSPCYYDEIRYANVISDHDAGKQGSSSHKSHKSGHSGCTRQQTRYVIDNSDNTICFSTRPLPSCKSSCRPTVTIEKNIPVHCVARSNVSDVWRKQIEKGANPDFSLKAPNKNLKMQVPQSCSK